MTKRLPRVHLRANLLAKILAATLFAALIPLGVLGFAAYRESLAARNDAITITRSGLDTQALSTLKMQATSVAGQISQVLDNAVTDTRSASVLPRTIPSYVGFYRSHVGTLLYPDGSARGRRVTVPLYREMAFINATGREQILIRDGRVMPPADLRQVSDPRSTTYGTETYFAQTRALPPRGIYVSHLTAWFATNPGQTAFAPAQRGSPPGVDGSWYSAYTGVIRFATPLYDARGAFQGMVMLSLDARFIMEPVIHLIPGVPGGAVPWPNYNGGTANGGSYGFAWDDEGWLIAHPLLARLRGLDPAGNIPTPFQGSMTPQQQAQHPFNMLTSQYHSQQPFMYRQALQHAIGYTSNYNAAGVPKLDVYAPILFSAGSYQRHGVFGGVIIGTFLTTFRAPAVQAGTAINNRIGQLLATMRWIAIGTAILIVVLALVVSLSITRPLAHLANAARAMGRGEFDRAQLDALGRQVVEDEVTELARVFTRMAEQVRQREQKLQQEVANLHIQIDLQKQERQVEEITGTDWFQYLSANARTMRSRYQNAGRAADEPSAEQ